MKVTLHGNESRKEIVTESKNEPESKIVAVRRSESAFVSSNMQVE